MWSAAVLPVLSYQVEQGPTAAPALCTAQDRHSMFFMRYLWGSAGPESQPEAVNGSKDKSKPAQMTSKVSQPTNSSALSTLCAVRATFHVVLTGYLWLSHSASQIVSDSAYEEPHDYAALSLHGAAPAPAVVKSNERPPLASVTHRADSATTTRSTEGSTSEMPTVARLPARQQKPGVTEPSP